MNQCSKIMKVRREYKLSASEVYFVFINLHFAPLDPPRGLCTLPNKVSLHSGTTL
jgi:hypothetical protein